MNISPTKTAGYETQVSHAPKIGFLKPINAKLPPLKQMKTGRNNGSVRNSMMKSVENFKKND